MAISNDELTKIRNSVNIVDIIGENINLEKKGKNYFGICPFHDDHNPSMSVSPEKQIYTCFVCGASGNVFTFVKDYLNISFMEAVNRVANISGITLSEKVNIVKKYEKEYKIYDLAVKFYKNNLKSEVGKKALEYLKSRNINENIINEFDIGVSLSDNSLYKLLNSKKYDDNILINLGLCNDGNTPYDIFRNRIMFPIHDEAGNPVAFSARIYDGGVDSKYINTKETYIFKKGEILFNYHRASNETKKAKSVILCEGQMDAIRIYSSGIKNVIATMGTALTNKHINLIKRLNVKVILNMDSDSAGIKASLANGEYLRKNNIEVSVIKLEGAKDPDEYINKYGVEAYKDVINHAISFFDFKLSCFKDNKNLNNPDELSEYINSVIKELNNTDDEILKTVTINKLASDYNIDKNILLSKITKTEKKNEVVTKKNIKQKQNIRAVEEILYYMMNNVKYTKLFSKELNYIPDVKYFEIAKDIEAYIILNNTITVADFISYAENNNKDNIIKDIIKNHNNDIEMKEEEFMSYINILKKWIAESKIEELKQELNHVLDMNRKKEIMETITKIKKGSVNDGK